MELIPHDSKTDILCTNKLDKDENDCSNIILHLCCYTEWALII